MNRVGVTLGKEARYFEIDLGNNHDVITFFRFIFHENNDLKFATIDRVTETYYERRRFEYRDDRTYEEEFIFSEDNREFKVHMMVNEENTKIIDLFY